MFGGAPSRAYRQTDRQTDTQWWWWWKVQPLTYPSSAGELAEMVDQFMANAIGDGGAEESGGAPKAVIAPHAGFIYS